MLVSHAKDLKKFMVMMVLLKAINFLNPGITCWYSMARIAC